ncbi:MAG: four helix bundle protein [Blastocatellia bacterium]
MSQNIVLEKAYQFALRIVRLYKYLVEEKKEYVMSRELLRAGTKLDEQIEIAQEATSKTGFAHDMNTALQYARATEFCSACCTILRIWARRSIRSMTIACN